MTYNTGNPVPSIDPRDLDDNAENLDNFVNGNASEYPDRLGVPRKSIAGLEEIVNTFASPNVVELGALVGAADRLPYFDGFESLALAVFTSQARQLLDDTSFADMLVTLGAAARGANNDITSLTGLSTPLSDAQGGTGVNTVAAYLALLVAAGAYSKTSILGAVSQSGGVPTGAVIESGGNISTTGRYIKFADGTLRQWKLLSIGTGSTTAKGSIFGGTATAAGNFTVPFITDFPIVHHSGTDGGGGGWTAMDLLPTLTAWGSYSTRNHVSSGSTGTILLTAEGRWF